MLAEIISIGTELTSGEKLDTNSQWLSVELSAIGIPVRFHTTMADDKLAMLEVFRAAIERSDVVLVTGGLGPTLDDLTRELLAELGGVGLVLHEPSLRYIQELFAKRAREFPERNRIQAMFPAGSEPLFNPIGTAPGIWMEVLSGGRGACAIAAMPGVPSEMKRMFREQVLPRLPQGQHVIQRVCIHCFGQGESAIEEMLGDLTARNRNPEVGITASAATITLRLAAHGPTAADCQRMLDQTREFIHNRLGELIFGEDDVTLEAATIAQLRRLGKTVSTVEIGTRGLLGQTLANADTAGSYYRGGVVVTSPSALSSDFGVWKADSGMTGREIAMAMANTCRQRFNTDYALSVAAFAPVEPASDIFSAHIAVASLFEVDVHEHRALSDPTLTQPRAAKTAINMLRLRLLREIA